MISGNILKLFKSHVNDPTYSIIIKDIKTSTECNQESIIFTVVQTRKSLSEILEENEAATERKLILTSNLAIDNDNLYYTKIDGYCTDSEYTPTHDDSLFSHYIEVLDVILEKTIHIDFTKKYKNQPKIIINVDKSVESLYRNPSFSYTIENKKYTGVDITFNSLKSKKSYPIISIVIIGDKRT